MAAGTNGAGRPTERFGNRVDDYERYRPGYPPELARRLAERGWLRRGTVVADVGAGTGISSALFLDAGATVLAVEPNAPMRAAAQRRLGATPGFRAVDGSAEATTLADASVDLAAAGTAFHWFEPRATRAEFRRILRGEGRVALFWNVRAAGSGLMREIEAILRAHCPGYTEADAGRRADEERVREFFGGAVEAAAFGNAQTLDVAGLVGRVQSSSYAPKPGEPAHAPLEAALRALFGREQRDGRVTLRYDTRLYLGTLG